MLKETERISTEQRMQIDLLNTQMKLREAELKNQQLHQRIYIGLIIILLLFAAILFRANHLKKKANRLLSEKNAEITAQKEEISRQADELRELNALKDRLFSIIAHDLRSPLFSLITMLNIAREGHFTEDSFREIIGELSTNVSHTTALLENLLTWAKNQMQGTKVKPENFFLNEVITPRLQQLSEVALQKDVTLINQVDDKTSVYADRDMLNLIIRNLISNAIKFCNAGDKIQVWSSLRTPT
jgi:signal transduction histidine kinase